MRERSVTFAAKAEDDLDAITDWIADASSPAVTIVYTDRLVALCDRLSLASERGSLDPRYGPSVRRVGFERWVAVLFRVTDEAVVIERLLNQGREDRPAD